MRKIKINSVEYEVVRDDGLLDIHDLSEKITDYFDDYDYIFIDQAYNKIRLKGFYDSNNKKCKIINDIKSLDDYILHYCAYGCKTVLLKKIK